MKDISNKFLACLIIIVIVLTVVFTWRALDVAQNAEQARQASLGYGKVGGGTGLVAINIMPPEEGAK